MSTRLNPDPLIRLVRSGRYLNRQLIAICASEGLNKNGVKAEFQQRIIERILLYAGTNDAAKFERLKRNIEHPEAIQSAAVANPAHAVNAYLNATFNSGMGGQRGHVLAQPRFEFKPSPFYTFEEQLGDTKTCEIMQNHRHTVTICLKAIDYATMVRVGRDSNYRVMAFCAGENQGLQDVAFPHQSEIKVNGGEIKANLRGLKNKPGSTRPVDITKELRLSPVTYGNNVELTYALTTKKFYFLLYTVKSIPVADLVTKLANGKRITEKSVLDEMASKARDTDIVTTASVLSLKCPLSTLRIDLPIRSVSCRHNQCFDATSYLQLQEQGPTWLCPICNNPAPFETLAVDEYVKDILQKTPRSADQVVVQPDGKWDVNPRKENASNPREGNFSDDSDDDDLVEITKHGESIRTATPQMLKQSSISFERPRDVSTSSLPSNASISSKRPHSAVIDLTSSGDEDEEPVAPAPKRLNVNGYGSPFPSSAHAYRPPPPPGSMPPR